MAEDLEKQLLSTELEGWQSLATGRAAEHYQERLASNAVMAFPFGTLTRQQALEAMEAAPPWSSFQLSDPQVMEIGSDAGALVYTVQAQRTGAPPYAAIVSSTFLRQDGHWLLAFHQQTPIDGGSQRLGRTR